VRLHARLGVPELALDAVMTLREGDVIRLEESLGEPSTLICGSTTLRCSGHLGALDGQRAIRLTPIDPGTED
jgi:flagellar motor switch protein FliM